MSTSPLKLLLLALPALALTGAPALAESVRLTPVKGATYTGLLRSDPIKVKVASNGKSATVSLSYPPAFCQGGFGPTKASTKPASISKTGALKATISFSSSLTHKTFATATIKGNFYTFGGSTPVFQGTVRSVFNPSTTCDGQESFQATKS